MPVGGDPALRPGASDGSLHFAVPASSAFIRDVSALAEERPEMSIFEAQPIEI